MSAHLTAIVFGMVGVSFWITKIRLVISQAELALFLNVGDINLVCFRLFVLGSLKASIVT